MRPTTSLFAGLLLLGGGAVADPTWPASTDELEEIMYQLQGFGARLFSDVISPCSNEASGPGRQNAAEWLRIGFHDMSTANNYFGIGGLDGSLQFELNDGENTGPGHRTTLVFMANYLSARSSLADLIAAGVYASVRSCGGPVVPVRGGRIDAVEAGSPGVPQPQNSIGTFTSQFNRMGFSVTEMIQVTACGHTLGGVHSSEFPDIVPAGTADNDEGKLDSTVASFDNKVVTEYLANTTTNPLVIGPVVGKRSDLVVFAADGNVTIKAMADETTFQSTCKTVLQKMIDVVPAGVVLTDPVTPYTVKPVNIQLSLNSPGSTLLLGGYIRIRKNDLPSNITNIKLTYKDRNGGNDCGTCSTTATVGGTGSGFDDQFAFFPISTSIDVATGISSFTVTINFSSGTSQTYDNNGNSYPISDAVLIQKPQSCLLQGTGALTVNALVRNDRTSLPVNLGVSYLVPRTTSDGNPVPALNNATIAMTKGDCVGQYTFYSANYTISGGQSYNARLDVTSGSGTDTVSDAFNAASELAGTCVAFAGSVACGGSTSSSTSSPSISSSTGVSSSSTLSTTSTSSTSSSTSPTATLGHRAKIGGYNMVSCWTEGTGARALSGAAFAYDGMTLESCMGNCTGYAYWGTEYGRECYCGNSLDSTSASAPLSDCNMVCGGDAIEYCGAGNRLELYLTTASQLPSSTSTSTASSSTKISTTVTTTSSSVAPTGTLAVKNTVGKYTFVGCYTEGTGVRALASNSYAADDMTLESCASFCTSYSYFGTEYGRECYCSNSVDATSTSASLSECNMVCAGNAFEYCGAGDRLELYRVSSASSSSAASSFTTSSTKASTTTTTPSTKASTTTTTTTSSTKASTTTTASSTKTSTTTTTTTSSTKASTTTTASSTKTSTTTTTSSTKASTTTATSSTKASTATTSSTKTSSSTSTSTSKASTSSATSSTSKSSTLITSTKTSTSVSTSASPTLAHIPTVSPYTLVGCWTEGDGTRALSGLSYTNGTSMTLSSCATFCAGYKYFGTEYGSECYCGDALASTSSSALLSECSMQCSGDAFEYCGAGNRLELYSNPNFTAPTEPITPSQPANVTAGSVAWEFKACYTEATASRALSSSDYAADDVTLESCAAFCASYTHFGTEYGRECYCGDALEAGSVATAASECSMSCAGDGSELCGAGNRLSVYTKQ